MAPGAPKVPGLLYNQQTMLLSCTGDRDQIYNFRPILVYFVHTRCIFQTKLFNPINQTTTNKLTHRKPAVTWQVKWLHELCTSQIIGIKADLVISTVGVFALFACLFH